MRSPRRSLRSALRRWCHVPPVAYALIGLHVGVFATCFFLAHTPSPIGSPGSADWLENWLALSGESLRAGQVWRIGTHLFLHENVWALLTSTGLLFFAGRNLEAVIGRRHFLCLYLLTGALTGGLRALGTLLPGLGPDSAALPIVGDLGATLAVLLAFATIMPEMEIGALIFLPAPSVRLKVRFVAVFTLLIPALLFLLYCSPTFADALGQARLGCLGAVGGALGGWLYVRRLGFGQRWPADEGEPALRGRRLSRGAENHWTRASDDWPPVARPGQTVASSSSSVARTASSGSSQLASPAASSLNTIVAAPLLGTTERERRMSTRQYIREAVDPILEKISREGMRSLTSDERRVLEICRDKIVASQC